MSRFFDEPTISQRISGLEYFLLGTYPINMGTNVHGEMHKQRYSFSKEEYEWHKSHNKLGLDCWGTWAGSVLIALNRMLKRGDLRVVDSFPTPKEYSAMPFEQKLALCISVDKKLYGLLDKLYAECK